MKTRLFSVVFFVVFAVSGIAQVVNDQVELLGSLAPQGPGNAYSDIWGYAAGGREYAILGVYTGTSIIDITDPAELKEVAFIPGPYSIWRDIKTYSHYAYVTHDANDNASSLSGVHIIDLSGLPESASLVNRYTGRLSGGRAHNLYIEKNFLYLAGGRQAGTNINPILDLTDPVNPVEIGSFDSNYWHDVVAINDTIYGSGLYGQGIQILDGTDKSNLKMISQTPYPDLFTHNMWMTADNGFIAVTDEVHDEPLKFWDVTDHKNPVMTSMYHPGKNAIPHNAHIRDNLVVMSYYYDGLKVIDISNRLAPVEVGNYDTYPDDNLRRAGGYDGAWGAYPFLPSGNMLVSDTKYGLFVLKFSGLQPGYLSGQLKDQYGDPVPYADILLTTRNASDGYTISKTNPDGSFTAGAKPGVQNFQFSAKGYDTLNVEVVSINSGQTINHNPVMRKQFRAAAIFTVSTQSQQHPPATIEITGLQDTTLYLPDGQGNVLLYEGTYKFRMHASGFLDIVDTFSVRSNDPILIERQLFPGITESFSKETSDWSLFDDDDNSVFKWELVDLSAYNSAGNLPKSDYSGTEKHVVMASKARRSSSGATLDAISTLTSPAYSIEGMQNPALSFAKFFAPQFEKYGEVKDTLKVFVSANGTDWMLIDSFSSKDSVWTVEKYYLNTLPGGSTTVQVRFVNIEGADGISIRPNSWCAIDEINIGPGNQVVSVSDSNSPNPDQLRTMPNYPNPFNPVTTIRWTQAFQASVNLQVINLIGQVVSNQTIGNRPAGQHTHQLNLDGYPSGVYFYRIHAGNRLSGWQKMVFLK